MEKGSSFTIASQVNLPARIFVADAQNTFNSTTDPVLDILVQSGQQVDGVGMIPSFEHLLGKVRGGGFNTVVTNKYAIKLDNEIQALANAGVEVIAVPAKGTNNLNLPACEKYGIAVVNAPSYAPPSVAQHTLSSIGTAANRIVQMRDFLNNGGVTEGFSYDQEEPINLNEATLGVYGWGQIGQAVGRIFKGAYPGITIVAHDQYAICEANVLQPDRTADSVEQLVSECSIVSLHASLSDDNLHVFNQDVLSHAAEHKGNFLLANFARGGLIEEAALRMALNRKIIDTAILDVTEDEPVPLNCWMRNNSRIILTLHTAWRNGRRVCVIEVSDGIAMYWQKKTA